MPKGTPNKRYTGEFKQMVIETMRRENLGYRETMQQFEISGHNTVQNGSESTLRKALKGCTLNVEGVPMQ